MKLKLLAIVAGSLALQVGFAAPKNANTQLSTNKDKYSYSIGVDIGKNLKAQNISVNSQMLGKGITDGYSGSKTLMSDDDMGQALQDLQKRMMAKQQQEMKQVADKNAKTGAEFLAKNKKAKGVKSLKNGLQYRVVTPGKGASPKMTDVVTVDYEGKLINGKVFDSSYKNGQPATFKVSEVIKGWQDALTQMKVGATWEVFVPAELAYGDKTLGGPIGPNETLIFKIHLISINKEPKKRGQA